jgi:hypothetical protein
MNRPKRPPSIPARLAPAAALLPVLVLSWTASLEAATTINASNRYAYGANTGWMDWRGDGANGAVIGPTYCSGNVYAANFGWLSLGSGAPINGVQYQNLSANDYGVNVDSAGNLRGYAWGANVGWIAFEANGAPAVDLASGNLSGYAWGANIGWLSLSNAVAFVQTIPLAPPPNDLCAGAIALADGVAFAQNTTTATSAGDPAPDCAKVFGKGVWFTYTAPASGEVIASTCGSSFDTVLAVYSGGCGALVPVICGDDNGPNCSGFNASVRFAASAGTTYHLLAGGYNGLSGDLRIVASLVPVLSLGQSAGNLTVSWPGNGRLQSATNLNPVVVWTDLTNGGGPWREPMTNRAKFFRIVK